MNKWISNIYINASQGKKFKGSEKKVTREVKGEEEFPDDSI
jgi:hypothetical protein